MFGPVEPVSVKQITRGMGRLLRVRRNAAIHERQLEWSIRDHGEWAENRDRALHRRLSEIDNDHESRGVFRSGTRLATRRDAKSDALRELRRRRAVLADLREDILGEETVLERMYRRVRRRPLPEVPRTSVEAKMEASQQRGETRWTEDSGPVTGPRRRA